jgi:MEDS: MEthanogen/methylotroph, DcmR Sensory domain
MSTDVLARHQCMIYDGSPSRTLPTLVAAICAQLDSNVRCACFNSPAMIAGLKSQLYAAGVDVAHELARGRLLLYCDTAHLVDGRFEIDHLIDTLDTAVQQASADGYAGLFATGDMTWEFGPEQDFAKLLEYEWRLEQLFHAQPTLSGICQYHCNLLPHEAVRDGVVSHGHMFVNDTVARVNPHYVPAASLVERRRAVRPVLDEAIAALLAANA